MYRDAESVASLPQETMWLKPMPLRLRTMATMTVPL